MNSNLLRKTTYTFFLLKNQLLTNHKGSII